METLILKKGILAPLSALLFYCFSFGDKKQILKALLTRTKAVPVDLNAKLISKFYYGFTNCDCLHCAILKALYGFMEKIEKSPQRKRNAIFPSKCSKCDFQDFENV